ncbi:MAG: hypothetical protein R3E83_13845 [Burkholderiaceae bacterium]
MPRLLVLLAVLMVGVWFVRQVFGAAGADRQTYRPRKQGARRAHGGAVFMARRADLAGLRDAFSAEPIDPARALVRCAQCQSFYHADSLVTLRRENGGRCASCRATAFDDVDVID